jgi:hypothetical protein
MYNRQVEESWTRTVLTEMVCLFCVSYILSLFTTIYPISSGNPIGGLVFSNAFTGTLEQVHEWTVNILHYFSCQYMMHNSLQLQMFVADTLYCFRACKDAPNAPTLCEHIYDERTYMLTLQYSFINLRCICASQSGLLLEHAGELRSWCL